MAQETTTTLSLDRYTPDAKTLIVLAQGLADERKHVEVLPLHFLVRALERDRGVREVFQRVVSNLVELEGAAERSLNALPRAKEPAYLSPAMLDLLERAQREATRENAAQVQVEHLLNALSQEIRGPAGELLGAYGVAPGTLRSHMSALRSVPRPAPVTGQTASTVSDYTRSLVDEAKTGKSDPVLLRVAEVRRLMTILERRQKRHPLLVGEPGVGKGAIIRALAQRVASGDVPTSLVNVRLLELEVGALVAGARLRGEIEERVRKLLDQIKGTEGDAILVARGIDQLFGQGPAGSALGELLEPALTRGEVRMLGTTTPEGLRKLEDRDPEVLRLFTLLPIEEPSAQDAIELVRGVAGRYQAHHGVDVSEGAIVSAVELAKRYVQDRFLPDSALDLLDEAASAKRVEVDGVPTVIDAKIRRVEALKAQLESIQKGDDDASKRTRLKLETELHELEPQVKEGRQAIDTRRGLVMATRTLRTELDAIKRQRAQAAEEKNFARVGELDHVTIPDLEKRVTKADEAAATAGIVQVPRVLTEQDVAATLAIWTGIPVAKMLEGEAQKLLKMEERLSQRVVGQDDAVRAMARAVRRGRVGLRDPGKPIGSFLFLGPSGVGKTELAKALAQFLFDDEQALTRMDMSEFMERHMAQRLIGAPPGYADSDQGGFLTEAVRRRPYSVLLFDEVEKAHQDVFNLLLQVLDDGRLTDGRGRLADFSNTVVIMTSNIGSDRILETDAKLFESDEGREALRDVLFERLRAFFRPEFLNRIDETLIFRPLGREQLRKVVDIQLRHLEKLLGERRVRVELDDASKNHLVELGYDPALGARPVKRTILRKIQDPLAEMLLNSALPDGSTIRVTLDGEELKFEKKDA